MVNIFSNVPKVAMLYIRMKIKKETKEKVQD